MNKIKLLLLVFLFLLNINVVNAESVKLYDYLLDNAVYDNIESEYVKRNGIDFSLPSSNIIGEEKNTNGLGLYISYKSKDDKYPMAYFRGNLTNNFAIFGNFCFQIIRTTENGGIKLLYAGPIENGKCNATGDSPHIGKYSYGSENSKKYLQYAYYDEESDTVLDSIIKEKVDDWFSSYMLDYIDNIEDSPFRNDLSTGVINAYLIRDRLYSGEDSPNYKCPLEYSYTVSSEIGNGLLKYPVAIINADDLTFAGGKLKTITPELQENVPFIFINVSYWAMSPYAPNKLMYPNTKNSINDNLITYMVGARPYLAIKNNAVIESGTGTRDNPFVLSFPTLHTITADSNITINKTSAYKGEKITFNVFDKEGFKIDKIFFNNNDSNVDIDYKLVNNNYSFLMPDFDLSISVSYVVDESYTPHTDIEYSSSNKNIYLVVVCLSIIGIYLTKKSKL